MARKTIVPDTSGSDSDEGTELNLQEAYNIAVKDVHDAAHKKATAISTAAHKSVGAVIDKYRHAVEVTHKAELEELFGCLRADLAAQDVIIAGEKKKLKALSAQLEDIIAANAKLIGEVMTREEKHFRESTATIQDVVDKEKVALARIA